ncbi:DUF5763 domain-containing protein [Pedobacter sp. KACC 23697]|uniref:DUF5763 domain-containing protein n=1 Tax=Pedobacter sp. KACC 23697 TaxID=3149230 RepID=UPI0038779B63
MLLGGILLFGGFSPKTNSTKEPVATCYGRNPCGACSTCSGCKYCNNGGICGICSSKGFRSKSFHSRPKKASSFSSVYVGQCKALTKKGARCKRNGDSGGYCWQHSK